MSISATKGGLGRAPTYGNLKHGAYGTRVYRAWGNMKTRCFNSKSEKYPAYGGRGITVCERWLKFENFLADMGHPPEGMTLERKDVDGNYCPENCIWADLLTQGSNKQKSVVFDGTRMSKREASRRLGLDPNAISAHMTRTGRTFDETVDYLRGT